VPFGGKPQSERWGKLCIDQEAHYATHKIGWSLCRAAYLSEAAMSPASSSGKSATISWRAGAGSQQVEHVPDATEQPAQARPPAALAGIDCNTVRLAHRLSPERDIIALSVKGHPGPERAWSSGDPLVLKVVNCLFSGLRHLVARRQAQAR
jgi:hypothetical protein